MKRVLAILLCIVLMGSALPFATAQSGSVETGTKQPLTVEFGNFVPMDGGGAKWEANGDQTYTVEADTQLLMLVKAGDDAVMSGLTSSRAEVATVTYADSMPGIWQLDARGIGTTELSVMVEETEYVFEITVTGEVQATNSITAYCGTVLVANNSWVREGDAMSGSGSIEKNSNYSTYFLELLVGNEPVESGVTSTDSSVATVQREGVFSGVWIVEPLKAGTTTLKVTVEEEEYTFELTIIDNTESDGELMFKYVEDSEWRDMAQFPTLVGETYQLQFYGDQSLSGGTFVSSDPSVVKYIGEGAGPNGRLYIFEIIGAGTATLTYTTLDGEVYSSQVFIPEGSGGSNDETAEPEGVGGQGSYSLTIGSHEYLIGFGFLINNGATLLFGGGNTTTSRDESSDTLRYQMPEATVYAAEVIETAEGAVYEEVKGPSAPFEIQVTKMEIVPANNTTIFSFSSSKENAPVLVKTSNFVTLQNIAGVIQEVPNSANYYFTRGEGGKADVVATVKVTMRNQEEYTVKVSMTYEVKLVETESWTRDANDTTERLNAFLEAQEITQGNVYTLNLHEDAVYTGEIRIPTEWRSVLGSLGSRLEIYGNGATVTGGINLGSNNVFQIEKLIFEKDANYSGAAVFNGATSLRQCTFLGYGTAVDATDGIINLRVANLFAGNEVAYHVNMDQPDGLLISRSDIQDNAFLYNGIAVKIEGTGEPAISPYMFRMYNSSFVGNDLDFDISVKGMFYMQRNYFGIAKDRYSRSNLAELKQFVEACLNADTQQDLNQLMERRGAIVVHYPRTKLFTDPCWKYPVCNFRFMLMSGGDYMFGYSPYDDGNYMILHGKHTRISHQHAMDLIVHKDGLDGDGISIDVADENEEIIGSWSFD